MQDRVALNPGRVLVTPEDGSTPYYATLERADNPTQVGTALSKANLLKDTTAAQFGLDSSAVPNDILSWLGKYNEYWWSLLHGEAYTYYLETRTLYQDMIYVSDEDGNGTIYYSSSIVIDGSTGQVSLSNPSTMTFEAKDDSDQNRTKMSSLSGKFISNFWYRGNTTPTNDVVWVMGDAGGYAADAYVGYSRFYGNQTYKIESEPFDVVAGETTYAHSTDRNAYPDSGTVDGITYTFLGVPFDNFPNSSQRRIEKGTYTGVGKYGSGNRNTLTFSFEPVAVIIVADYTSNTASGTVLIRGQGHSAGIGTNYNAFSLKQTVTWSGKTIAWYSTEDATRQLNVASTTYYYVAIG